jgi:hypothetical protein
MTHASHISSNISRGESFAVGFFGVWETAVEQVRSLSVDDLNVVVSHSTSIVVVSDPETETAAIMKFKCGDSMSNCEERTPLPTCSRPKSDAHPVD